MSLFHETIRQTLHEAQVREGQEGVDVVAQAGARFAQIASVLVKRGDEAFVEGVMFVHGALSTQDSAFSESTNSQSEMTMAAKRLLTNALASEDDCTKARREAVVDILSGCHLHFKAEQTPLGAPLYADVKKLIGRIDQLQVRHADDEEVRTVLSPAVRAIARALSKRSDERFSEGLATVKVLLDGVRGKEVALDMLGAALGQMPDCTAEQRLMAQEALAPSNAIHYASMISHSWMLHNSVIRYLSVASALDGSGPDHLIEDRMAPLAKAMAIMMRGHDSESLTHGLGMIRTLFDSLGGNIDGRVLQQASAFIASAITSDEDCSLPASEVRGLLGATPEMSPQTLRVGSQKTIGA